MAGVELLPRISMPAKRLYLGLCALKALLRILQVLNICNGPTDRPCLSTSDLMGFLEIHEATCQVQDPLFCLPCQVQRARADEATGPDALVQHALRAVHARRPSSDIWPWLRTSNAGCQQFMDSSPAVGNYHYLAICSLIIHKGAACVESWLNGRTENCKPPLPAKAVRSSSSRTKSSHLSADLAALTLAEVPALRQIAAKETRKLFAIGYSILAAAGFSVAFQILLGRMSMQPQSKNQPLSIPSTKHIHKVKRRC